jgi:hypothetical protein
MVMEAMPAPTAPQETPTPTPEPGNTSTPKPPGPAPITATPTDPPTPTPTTKPPKPNNGCGEPIPPPLSSWSCKVHLRHTGNGAWVLDSTPLVGPDRAFCLSIGYTDNRSYCSPRPHGHREREACEAYIVGRSDETGELEPTWRRNGHFCTGVDCQRVDNPFLLDIFADGAYTVCGENGVCCQVDVDDYDR